MKIVAVKDSAIDAFGTPFTVKASGEAIRSFIDELLREGSEMGKHPHDYDLWELAEYNNDTGKINQEGITKLARGADHAPQPERERTPVRNDPESGHTTQ